MAYPTITHFDVFPVQETKATSRPYIRIVIQFQRYSIRIKRNIF